MWSEPFCKNKIENDLKLCMNNVRRMSKQQEKENCNNTSSTCKECAEFVASKDGLCSICWKIMNNQLTDSDRECLNQETRGKAEEEILVDLAKSQVKRIPITGTPLNTLYEYVNHIATELAKQPRGKLEPWTPLVVNRVIEVFIWNKPADYFVSTIDYEFDGLHGYIKVCGKHGDRIVKDGVGWYEPPDGTIEIEGAKEKVIRPPVKCTRCRTYHEPLLKSSGLPFKTCVKCRERVKVYCARKRAERE